jgi:hypothetical protein
MLNIPESCNMFNRVGEAVAVDRNIANITAKNTTSVIYAAAHYHG